MLKSTWSEASGEYGGWIRCLLVIIVVRINDKYLREGLLPR